MAITPLEYQLEMIKVEIETVNTTIRQMDDITKSVKEWTVGLWAAAVGGALVTPRLSAFVGVTAVIPLLFWLVDTWHRRVQRKFIWRSMEISDFLNGPRLHESFAEQRLVGFTVMDPKARTTTKPGYHQFISWRKIMLFRSLSILYIGLAAISAFIGLVLYWV